MSNSIYYVYKILFETGEYYIGRRKCPSGVSPREDSYTGSPVTNKNYWVDNNFTKIILETYDIKEDHERGEGNHLGDSWKTDPLCLNASPANNKSNANMIWANNGVEEGMFIEMPEGWSLGRLGTSAKGKKYFNNGLESKMFFEGQQPEGWVLGNLSSQGDNNASRKYGSPVKNKITYSNGSETVYISAEEDPPEGYKKGRSEDFKEKRRKATVGSNNPRYGSRGEKWYNNGFINKLYTPGNEEPGFVRGMVKRNDKR
jgi:hypothetical protein